MQYLLLAVRRYAEDRASTIRAALICRTVENAMFVDKTRVGEPAVGSLTEAVQHLFFAARRNPEDGAAALGAQARVRTAGRGSAVKCAGYIEQNRQRIVAIESLAEAVQHF